MLLTEVSKFDNCFCFIRLSVGFVVGWDLDGDNIKKVESSCLFMARRLNYEKFSKEKIVDEIMKKKEFSKLPRKDVVMVYSYFEEKDISVEEKIKLSRDLLRKMYTAFVSDKLLTVKDKDAEWFLRKHISTKERMDCYLEVYEKCLDGFSSEVNVFDFGCGINGFSYEKFKELGYNVNYVGTEPVEQLCDLQNSWFEARSFNARVEKLSLFDLKENVEVVKGEKGEKIAFFFKVLDSLEMLKRNFSKEVLAEIVPLVDKVVVSWATRSLVSKKKFHAERTWLKKFVLENFKIIGEFDCGVEHYLVFSKR